MVKVQASKSWHRLGAGAAGLLVMLAPVTAVGQRMPDQPSAVEYAISQVPAEAARMQAPSRFERLGPGITPSRARWTARSEALSTEADQCLYRARERLQVCLAIIAALADMHGEAGNFLQKRETIARGLTIALQAYGTASPITIALGAATCAPLPNEPTTSATLTCLQAYLHDAQSALGSSEWLTLRIRIDAEGAARRIELRDTGKQDGLALATEVASAFPQPDWRRLDLNRAVVAALVRDDQPSAALDLARQNLREAEQLFGRTSAQFRDSLTSLALAEYGAEIRPAAALSARRALNLTEQLDGRDSFRMIEQLNLQAMTHCWATEFEACESAARRAIALAERFDPETIELFEALGHRGMALRYLGRFVEARAMMERALEVMRGIDGPDSIRTWRSEVSLAQLLFASGDIAAGRVAFDSAIMKMSAGLEPQHPTLLRALFNRCRLDLGTASDTSTVTCFERFLNQAGNSENMPVAAYEMAENEVRQSLVRLGRRDEARAYRRPMQPVSK